MNFSSIEKLKGLHIGADAAQISGIEQQLGVALPKEYVDFLLFSNGCLLENGLSMYPLENLVERNKTFEIPVYVPGYILMGDDSSGTGILLSAEPMRKKIYASGLGDLNPFGFKEIADSFQSWVDSGFRGTALLRVS